MKTIISILISIVFVFSAKGQNNDSEYYRALGYQAKVAGDYQTATENYLKILNFDSADYDAWLALARLYTIQEDYLIAIKYFNNIYRNDSSDVEAVNGLGNCYLLLGENEKSIQYFEEALQYLPGNVQQYFYLAKAYSFAGRLDDAIKVYKEVIQMDESYAEAWAGIGKMYFWKGKPKTADMYYSEAVKLDPQNEELKTERFEIQNELKFGLSLKVGPMKEVEDAYTIKAINTKVKLDKRINDHFYVEANYLLDYSNRVFTDNIADTTRWFNSTWIKGTWITTHSKVSAWLGYSTSDNLFSTYGVNWKLNYTFGKVTLTNFISAGYDYYYYWNRVGAKSFSENLGLSYGNLSFSAFYSFGNVDPVLVADISSEIYDISDNPYNAYSLSLAYKILAKPVIKIGLNHSFLNYTYKSPLYYSPFDRKLTGASASIYYDLKKFYLYGSFSYNLGTEIYYDENTDGNGSGNNLRLKEVKMNVNNWSTNIELGYNLYPFTFSVGGSNFYNPFYQNLTGFVAIKILL